jgi:hypothetical protein
MIWIPFSSVNGTIKISLCGFCFMTEFYLFIYFFCHLISFVPFGDGEAEAISLLWKYPLL